MLPDIQWEQAEVGTGNESSAKSSRPKYAENSSLCIPE
ncbi:hypothetical protein NC99_11750 [Sunxiuqinia dokdonensis]|uniref:Uncharacterized protein n=1 Tax=Sunxiuqinia dokdonensis TaxID=1409788 RepID=A0A0L8VCT7_9BACT|nr:hypothetical protein NC99_11750 [Sunxiuqinia dokdonensis]